MVFYFDGFTSLYTGFFMARVFIHGIKGKQIVGRFEGLHGFQGRQGQGKKQSCSVTGFLYAALFFDVTVFSFPGVILYCGNWQAVPGRQHTSAKHKCIIL